MGFVCRGDVKLDATEAASSQTTLDEQSEDPLPDDYYENEDVLQRRLCKDSLTYEYKVRFKGYQSDDDMWLPASYFNRAINFESMSMFGRKRKHKIDPDAARDVASTKRRTSSNESQQSMKKGRSTSQESSSFRRCRMQVQETKTAVIKNRCHKGKAGPSSLSSIQGSDTDTPESQEVTSKTSKSKPCRSTLSNSELPSDSHDPLDQQSRKMPMKIGEYDEQPCQEKTKGSRYSVSREDANVNQNTSPKRKNHKPKKMRKTVRTKGKGKAFRSSLASISIHDNNDSVTIAFPPTSPKSNCVLSSENSGMAMQTNETPLELFADSGVEGRGEWDRASKKGPTTPKTGFERNASINVDNIPSEEITLEMGVMAEVLRRNDNFCFPRRLIGETKFPDVDRTLSSFSLCSGNCVLTDPLKVSKLPPQSVLFDTGTYLASYHGYNITSQELSQLCGERYLSDEILNFLGQKYCDKSNQNRQGCHNILLPSFLSTGEIFENVVVNICANNDLDSAKRMFLPVHINSNHWGLAVFSVIDKTVFFDDGYHSPIPGELKRNAHEIIKVVHQATSNDKFLPSKWSKIRRFRVPMPDQPDSSTTTTIGCGSCGVAVLCTIRDFCNGRTNGFSWAYEDAPRLRLELMLEILGMA